MPMSDWGERGWGKGREGGKEGGKGTAYAGAEVGKVMHHTV